jgi:hypothetical protein
MFRSVCCSVLASLTLLAASLNAQTATFLKKTVDVKDGTFSLYNPAQADMNEDGIPDIISVTSTSLTAPEFVSILVSKGAGSFNAQPNQYAIPAGYAIGNQPMVADHQ